MQIHETKPAVVTPAATAESLLAAFAAWIGGVVRDEIARSGVDDEREVTLTDKQFRLLIMEVSREVTQGDAWDDLRDECKSDAKDAAADALDDKLDDIRDDAKDAARDYLADEEGALAGLITETVKRVLAKGCWSLTLQS